MSQHDDDTPENPDRRKALRTAALIGAGAAGAGIVASFTLNGKDGPKTAPDGAPAIVTGRRELSMVTTWPKRFPGLGTGAERVARRITELSGGRLSVTLYAAGELVPALGAFDAVAQGKADMYHGAEYYWQGKSPGFNFFAAVPFGMTAPELMAWVRFGGGQQLWDGLAARFNVKPLLAGNSGQQMGGWFKRRMDSLDAFRGLRIRMPGLGGEVMARLGATPVTKAGGELFQALSQGNIDATEWVGPWNDMAFAFHTIVPYYYYPGIHEPGTGLSLGVNLPLWQDLSAQDRTIIAAAAAAENDVMYAEFNMENARALKRLRQTTDVEILPFSDAILKRMAELSAQVLEEAAEKSPEVAAIHTSFLEARGAMSDWFEIAENAFSRARRLVDQT